eukprot:CCRYP_001977-RA/>CCRYP_001977-RA protein AED:0.26 eAED:0.26 QI:0/0/0/1/1/1/2/0/636
MPSTDIPHDSTPEFGDKNQCARFSRSLHRLTHEEEMSLLRKMRSHSAETLESQAARQTLLLHNLPLVQSIVSKTMKSHPRLLIQGTEPQIGAALSRDDLINEGMIGLAEALDKYDFIYSDLNSDNSLSPQGARLGTYATYWIRARIMRAIQSREHAFRFPERILQASHRLVKAARELELEWNAVVELQDADSAEKKMLRSKLCHVAGITSDILFREAIRVRTMSSPTTTTQLESWMYSAPSSGSHHEHKLQVNEKPETGCQHIHDTLSKFLMPREVQVLSLRYGLVCPDQKSSSKPVVFRDYQAEAEEDLFGPNGILPHYSDVPIEQRIPALNQASALEYTTSEKSSVTSTGNIVKAGIQKAPSLRAITSSQHINLSTSSALLPFKEVGFAPVASTTTAPASFADLKTARCSTAAFVAAKSTPHPRFQIKKGKGGTLFVNQFNQAPASLVLRSAVIQSYRVEDEFHPRVQESDAFSLLPARLSSIKRIESPSQFQSLVLDESNSLVVVRFYADACPSCKATSPLFRRWSRAGETLNAADSVAVSNEKLAIKIVEMPLNKKTSLFMQEKLGVDQLPYCHLYHPQLGLVEEQLVMNKLEFREFVSVVDKWAKGLATAQFDNCVICSKEELMEDCEEFC